MLGREEIVASCSRRIFLQLPPAFFCLPGFAQNVIDRVDQKQQLEAIEITSNLTEHFVTHHPYSPKTERMTEWRPILEKLEAHIHEFLGGFPWKPFHHTLGISGVEVYFDHPNILFYSLAMSLPFLQTEKAEKVQALLNEELKKHPPFAIDGYDCRTGSNRERYMVPGDLRIQGVRKDQSLFGVYAFWLYSYMRQDPDLIKSQWDFIRQRIQTILYNPYNFDIHKRDYSHDEAQRLNGDLAGVLAATRMARSVGDQTIEKQAFLKTQELLERRINLCRVNPQIITKTHAAAKSLHNYKLARYCDMTPEIGIALRRWASPIAVDNIREYRLNHNGWHLAFGDRLIGGENYTTSMQYSRALFACAAWIEDFPANQLLSWVDVPWCTGDLYFIEKSVMTCMKLNPLSKQADHP